MPKWRAKGADVEVASLVLATQRVATVKVVPFAIWVRAGLAPSLSIHLHLDHSPSPTGSP